MCVRSLGFSGGFGCGLGNNSAIYSGILSGVFLVDVAGQCRCTGGVLLVSASRLVVFGRVLSRVCWGFLGGFESMVAGSAWETAFWFTFLGSITVEGGRFVVVEGVVSCVGNSRSIAWRLMRRTRAWLRRCLCGGKQV